MAFITSLVFNLPLKGLLKWQELSAFDQAQQTRDRAKALKFLNSL